VSNNAISTKDELIRAIQGVADRGGDPQQRIGFGAPGDYVEDAAGELKPTGSAWTPTPKTWDMIAEGLADFIDQGGTMEQSQIDAVFDSDDAGIPVFIGRVPAGTYVERCDVVIETTFGGGATITVGDANAQGRLQAAADNDTNVAAHYDAPVNFEYTTATDVYLYLNGAPRIGNGRVIVYF